jgi:hypothetical protein
VPFQRVVGREQAEKGWLNMVRLSGSLLICWLGVLACLLLKQLRIGSAQVG